jgi:hypothetical protein
MRANRKAEPEFGKRGREKIEPTERNATVVQRLKKTGSRWWDRLRIKKGRRVKGFQRGQQWP